MLDLLARLPNAHSTAYLIGGFVVGWALSFIGNSYQVEIPYVHVQKLSELRSHRPLLTAITLPRPTPNSCMDGLLHMGVNLHHLVIQVRMVANHDLRIPCSSNKNAIDATTNRGSEDVADLQANQEGVGYDDGRVAAVGVVGGRREDHVQVGQQRAGVAYKGAAHAEHGADQAFVDQGVDAAVFYHSVGLRMEVSY